MGSSVVAGLIEKLGYLQLPFRNYDLLGLAATDSSLAKLKLLENFIFFAEHHSQPTRQGTRSAYDRLTYEPSARVDLESFTLNFRNVEACAQHLSFPALYDAARRCFGEALTYKKIPTRIFGHVELVTSINDNVTDSRLETFRKVFPGTKVIFMRRNFVDWAESLAGYRLRHPYKKWNYLYSDLIRRFHIYEESISIGEENLSVEFDDVFQPRTRDFIQTLCKFLNHNFETVETTESALDLFGQSIDFDEATTAADFRGRYLTVTTLNFLDKLKPDIGSRESQMPSISTWKNAVIFFLYLCECVRHFVRESTSKIKDYF